MESIRETLCFTQP